MARFIPEIDLTMMEYSSERDLARVMQKGLPDTFIVMHSLPWLRPQRDHFNQDTKRGEADFLVLHQDLGLLVIEAKGGEIVVKGREWYRRFSDARPDQKIKDPAEQANKSMWELRSRFPEGLTKTQKLYFSQAVAFPHCELQGVPPLNLPEETIISRRDLTDIEGAIRRAYHANGAGKEREKLTDEEFKKVCCILTPHFSSRIPLCVGVDHNAHTLDRLTQHQQTVLSGMEQNNYAIIEGVAGSGKTFIAIQRARSFAAKYDRVLLTCYNAELSQWLRENLHDELIENGGNLFVRNFHGVASDLCAQAGIVFRPDFNDAEWWEKETPNLLLQAAASLFPEKAAFDAIVVDEAQDFYSDWWETLFCLGNAGERPPMWAFYDKAQSVYRAPTVPPIANAFHFYLPFNCRNTRRITTYANVATQNDSKTALSVPLGDVPKIIIPSSAQDICGQVEQEIHRLLTKEYLKPSQIAILGPSKYERSSLRDLKNINGTLLLHSATEWREGKGVLYSTPRRFKGLEADVILLCDFSGTDTPQFSLSDLYVAITRARSHLIVVVHNHAAEKKLKAALTAAAGEA